MSLQDKFKEPVAGLLTPHLEQTIGGIYVHDWHIMTFTDLTLRHNLSRAGKNDQTVRLPSYPLQSGMLITAFDSITEGHILWDGDVNLEYERGVKQSLFNPNHKQQAIFGLWVHGFEETLQPQEWAQMFFSHLPAQLTKADNTVVYGSLEPFWETGTEGVIWALSEYGKTGYDELNCINNNDHLTIYNNVTNGHVAWHGQLDFEETDIPRIYQSSPHIENKTKRSPKHVDEEKWHSLFSDHSPAIIEPSS